MAGASAYDDTPMPENSMDEEKSRLFLIADDEPANRLVLSSMLKKIGYSVIEAENGQQAVELFEQYSPDLVLMDVMMPVMNGYDATRTIKSMESNKGFTPVIFLTALTDDTALSKCVEFGGDDFLTKPLNFIILKAKIDALMRVSNLYDELNEHKNNIEKNNARLQYEHELAEAVIKRVIRPESLEAPHLKYTIRPQSITSGDILLASSTPSGTYMIMIGDFTGHGLSAAVGALPTSDIFYAMSSKGFSISDILSTINSKLNSILPTGFYLAASILELSPEKGFIKVWNGGLPDILVRKEDGRISSIPSGHLPLGIIGDDEFDGTLHLEKLDKNDHIYFYSDGLTEAVNPEGDQFGDDRLLDTIKKHEKSIFEAVLSDLDDYTGDAEQLDDITLAEISCQAFSPTPLSPSTKKINCWNESLIIPSQVFSTTDIPAHLLNDLSLIPEIAQESFKINLILNELYTNALDHGILEMDSSLKSDPDGFYKYYEEREKKLTEIDHDLKHYIHLTINYSNKDDGPSSLEIKIFNSGNERPTIDSRGKALPASGDNPFSGRGLELINHYSEELHYSPDDNIFSLSLTLGNSSDNSDPS